MGKLFRWLIHDVKILSCSFPNILDHDKDLAKMPNQIPAGVYPLPWVESEIGEIMFQQIQCKIVHNYSTLMKSRILHVKEVQSKKG